MQARVLLDISDECVVLAYAMRHMGKCMIIALECILVLKPAAEHNLVRSEVTLILRCQKPCDQKCY